MVYQKRGKKYGKKNNLPPKMRKAVDKEITKVLRRRVEPKGYDSSASNVLIGNGLSTYIQALSPIPQGTEIDQRIGNKVKPMSLSCRFQLSGATNSTLTGPFSNAMRILILQDQNDDGTVPAASDIFVTSSNVTSALNWENYVLNKRFKILMDKFFQLNKVDTTNIFYDAGSYKAIYKNMGLGKCGPVIFFTTAGNSYGKGQLYLVVMSDSNTDKPTLNYTIRLKYQDL